jgi:RNA polymerase sigma factor for flagellar operon FliA
VDGISTYKSVEQHKSLDAIISENSGLVKKIAHHLLARLPSHISLDDLIQSGTIGLIEAAYNYDPSKGASFSTYAGIRIRGAILDEIRKGDWAPRSVHKNTRQISQAIAHLEAELGRDVTQNEIAQHMNISVETLNQMMNDTHNCKVVSFEDLGVTHDVITDGAQSSHKTPEALFEYNERKRILADVVKNLPEREKLVIALYYDEELNLKEIGQVINVSESRVSQILSSALHRMQARLGQSSAEKN